MPVLPGQIRPLRGISNITCAHEDCEHKATLEVIGEVDSFGYESDFYCSAHGEVFRKASPYTLSTCDHCSTRKMVRPCRDPAEGDNGPVYFLCDECNRRMVNDFIGD